MSDCIGPINIIPDNNQVVLLDNNRSITVIDNNCCTNVDITQPVTSVVQVLTGPIGPRGEFPTSGSVSLTGSFNVSGSISANYFYGGSFSGSFTGSFSGSTTDTLQDVTNNGNVTTLPITASSFYGNGLQIIGNATVTGSLTVSGSNTFKNIGPAQFTGSVDILGTLTAPDITGSLYGTSSWAEDAISSSYTLSSSYAESSSYAQTASYVLNAVSASYSDTASYVETAQTASYVLNAVSSSYASTASYAPDYLPLTGGTINGDVIVNGTASVYFLNVTYESSSVIYSSGSNQFGDNTDDIQLLIGTVKISGSQQITGSSYQTGTFYPDQIDWINSSIGYNTGSYILTTTNNGLTVYANYQDIGIALFPYINTGSFSGSLDGTASYAINSATASNILGGKATHVPYFITDTSLATSSIYQSGSTSVIINQDNNTTANPEALYVWQPSTSSFNVISGKGNLDNYLQLNIQNTNQGTNASSDVVATANNGSEVDNYIDMGINSENFAGFLGGPNDSYLYTHAHNFWIGNINDGYQTFIFNSSSLLPIITLNSDNAEITGSLYGTASWAENATSASYALTASYASNVPATASFAISASHALNSDNAISASHALVADNALTANYAATAGNGGVTQLIAGSGITLIPAGGQGAVTIASSGGGGVTIISGSLVTGSFTNTNSFTFNHNLSTRTPIITVFDSNYNQIIPQNIQLVDTSSAIITFPTLESGFAIGSTGGTTGTVLSSSYALFSTYADTASFVATAQTASYYLEKDPIFVAKSASLATTGSNTFRGNQTITGSIFSTGSIILVGNQIVTGSLTVSGSSTFTNIGPAIFSGSVTLVNGATGSLLGTASLATTASYTLSSSYASNADLLDGKDSTVFATTGSNTFIGNQIVTGSLFTTGSNTLIGNTVLSGSINISGSQTFYGTSTFYGNHTLSGSNTITGNTIMSGSIEVSGSSNFRNSVFIVTGSTYFTGSHNINGNANVTGSLNVTGNINVISGSSFTRWGNKLFNYGQFLDTTTQSGSANTAYTMKFNTTDFALGVSIVSGSRITVENTGIYNLQFSAQLANTANTTIAVDIWFAITGSNVPNSNTQINITKTAGSTGRSVAAWNFATPLSSSQYMEIYWSCDANTAQIQASPSSSAPSRPAIPSIIATLTQIA